MVTSLQCHERSGNHTTVLPKANIQKRASIFFNIVQYLKVQCQALNIFKKIIRLYMSVRPLLSSETNKIIDEISLIFNRFHVVAYFQLLSLRMGLNIDLKKIFMRRWLQIFLTIALKWSYLFNDIVITREKKALWHLNRIFYQFFNRG